VLHASLTELELERPVDAVFSNAVFHWIANHVLLFERLFAALRPGGRLVAQCGGAGNVEAFHEVAAEVGQEPPFGEHLGTWEGPWNFATADATSERLTRAGFERVLCSLEPWPVRPAEPEAFIRTVCLGHHIDRLPAELRAAYVSEVARRFGDTLPYVRLNIDARRPE
jgi:trans-aconitate 2-methyltransferase